MEVDATGQTIEIDVAELKALVDAVAVEAAEPTPTQPAATQPGPGALGAQGRLTQRTTSRACIPWARWPGSEQ